MKLSTRRVKFVASLILTIIALTGWRALEASSAESVVKATQSGQEDITAARTAIDEAIADRGLPRRERVSKVAQTFYAYETAVARRQAEIYQKLKELDLLIDEPASESAIDDTAKSPFLHPRHEVSQFVYEYDSYRAELSALNRDLKSVTAKVNPILEVQGVDCPPVTAINGTLGSGSPDFPSTSGQQTGRILNGLGNVTCGSSNPCTLNTTTGLRNFDAYTFINTDSTTACVTVRFTMTGCNLGQAMQFSARLGSFDPANPCTNYVGDGGAGFSGEADGSFSFNVPAGETFVVVVNENDPAGATGCAYSISITGLACQAACPPTTTINGTLGSGSTDFPSTSGQQTGRILNGLGNVTCGSSNPCSLNTTVGSRVFDAYAFVNPGASTACVTVDFTMTGCNLGQSMQFSARLGSFDPANPCTNYVGDGGAGFSGEADGSFSFNVPAGETFIVVVNENDPAGATGCAYTLTISGVDCQPICPPSTITGTIGQGSTDYPSASGVQTGRVSQNGVDSSCESPKTCPGISSAGLQFAFDSYEFLNDSNSSACVTFTFPTSCDPNNAIHPVAYLGSFDPANPCANYLGDIGHSINGSESGEFSVDVPANSTVVLIVHEIGTQPGCQDYSFSVTGLPCQSPPAPCMIICPSNITQPNDTGQCGAVINYSEPILSGDCGIVVCNPPSSSFFPVGATTVTCTTASGESCSFTVTVNQTEPPVITCPANITAVAPASCNQTSGAVITFPTPTASDACGSVTTVCLPASGSTFPVGSTTVTCTATGGGGSSNCSFTVIVFGGCLQDDSNAGNAVLFNTSTGEYRFCCGGVVIAEGIGTVTKKGCEYTIQHNASDRRVLIKPNFGAGKGSASIQSPPGVIKCSITDRNILDNTCQCGGV